MKTIKTLLLAALIARSPAVLAKTIEMEVNGLVCAFCAQGIEKTMKGFDATQDVFVSLETRLVAVQLKDGSDIADAELTQAITDAGYTVVGIRRTDAALDTLREAAEAGDD
jgi:mercuric ion binding protein